MQCIKILLFTLLLLLLTACSTLGNKKNTKITIAELNIQLGMNAIERNNLDDAKNKLSLALHQAPELPEAWYSMAYYFEKMGETAKANQYYLKALHLAPHRADVQYNYADYLCRIHDKKAFQHFKLAIKAGYINTAAVYKREAICALDMNDKQLAKKYFKLALASKHGRKLR